MRLWLLSDLHLERADWTPPAIPDADICIVAGDTDRGAREAVDWMAAEIRPHMPVIGVLGNHEFYYHKTGIERSEAARHGRLRDVVMLDDTTVVIDGTRFVGGTLWTDFHLYGTPRESAQAAYDHMNDFKLISHGDNILTPTQSALLHAATMKHIYSVLESPFDGDTVVVSHHSPSPRSLSDEYEPDDPLNAAFHSKLEWIIERYQPALWVHGHTHSSADYEIGSTRVVCNPRGYFRYGENENPAFDPGLVIEIGELKPRPGM